MSRRAPLSDLADAFGRCVATFGRETVRYRLPPGPRLRKIARLLDRLARRPSNCAWHVRAEKLHREIDLTLRSQVQRPSTQSLWATA